MQKQTGFILMVVLIFLLILSATSLSTLAQIKQNLRVQSLQNLHDTKHEKAIAALRILEKIPSANCFIPITPAMGLSHKPASWWQAHACSAAIASIRYYYAFENLGMDACAVTKDGQNVEYYRLTVVSAAKHVQDNKVFLQSSVANAVKSQEECPGQKHTAVLGEQMLREI